jgi:hypothetical protein
MDQDAEVSNWKIWSYSSLLKKKETSAIAGKFGSFEKYGARLPLE